MMENYELSLYFSVQIKSHGLELLINIYVLKGVAAFYLCEFCVHVCAYMCAHIYTVCFKKNDPI